MGGFGRPGRRVGGPAGGTWWTASMHAFAWTVDRRRAPPPVRGNSTGFGFTTGREPPSHSPAPKKLRGSAQPLAHLQFRPAPTHCCVPGLPTATVRSAPPRAPVNNGAMGSLACVTLIFRTASGFMIVRARATRRACVSVSGLCCAARTYVRAVLFAFISARVCTPTGSGQQRGETF
jgi:hypothetical protein